MTADRQTAAAVILTAPRSVTWELQIQLAADSRRSHPAAPHVCRRSQPAVQHVSRRSQPAVQQGQQQDRQQQQQQRQGWGVAAGRVTVVGGAGAHGALVADLTVVLLLSRGTRTGRLAVG